MRLVQGQVAAHLAQLALSVGVERRPMPRDVNHVSDLSGRHVVGYGCRRRGQLESELFEAGFSPHPLALELEAALVELSPRLLPILHWNRELEVVSIRVVKHH